MSHRYTSRESELAARRLDLLAAAYEKPTREFLAGRRKPS